MKRYTIQCVRCGQEIEVVDNKSSHTCPVDYANNTHIGDTQFTVDLPAPNATISVGSSLDQRRIDETISALYEHNPPVVLVAKNKKQQKQWQKDYPHLKVVLEQRM